MRPITGTQVEVFAEDEVVGFTQQGYPITIDGILHPDYTPNVIDVAEWERDQQ